MSLLLALNCLYRERPARLPSGAWQPRLPRVTAAEFDPSRTFATVNCRIAKGLFDHLVGGDEQRRWHGDAERFCGLEVDDQLEHGRLKDRQIGGLCALKDLAGVGPRGDRRRRGSRRS